VGWGPSRIRGMMKAGSPSSCSRERISPRCSNSAILLMNTILHPPVGADLSCLIHIKSRLFSVVDDVQARPAGSPARTVRWWASLPHSHFLLCTWLATAILPSTMRPGRSRAPTRLVRSGQKRDDKEETEKKGAEHVPLRP
jgi:hypothetical protein